MDTAIQEFMPLIQCDMPEDYERGNKDQRRACAAWLYDYLKHFVSPSRMSGDILCMNSEQWQSVKYHLRRIGKGIE